METLPINVLDIGVLVVLLASGLLALLRGFFNEVLLIVSWVGAFFATLYGDVFVRPYVRDLIDHDLGATLATWAGIFVVTLILLSVVTHYLGSALKSSSLSAVDRSLGFVFGLLRGAVLVCLSYLAIVWFADGQSLPRWVSEARSRPLIEHGARFLLGLVPADKRVDIGIWNDQVRSETLEAIQRQRFERLVAPTVKADAPPGADGYTEDQRREMDRVMGATR